MWVSTAARAETVSAPSTNQTCVNSSPIDSFACGDEATATGGNNTAVGDHSFATSTGANGTNTGTTPGRASAFGSHAEAQGYKSTAVGAFSRAGWDGNGADPGRGNYNDYATAIGAGAYAASDYSTGLGPEAHAIGVDSTAVGAFTTVNHSNAAAFGAHVSRTRNNQMAFGLDSNTYTMAGINSAASKSFQSGPTYFTTSDAQWQPRHQQLQRQRPYPSG